MRAAPPSMGSSALDEGRVLARGVGAMWSLIHKNSTMGMLASAHQILTVWTQEMLQ